MVYHHNTCIVLTATAWLYLGAAAQQPPPLRFQATAVVWTKDVASPRLNLVSRRFSRRQYTAPTKFEVIDENNHIVSRGAVALDGQRTVDLAGNTTRTCLLYVESGHNGVVLQSNAPYCLLASKAYNLRVKGFGGRLYFYVPRDCGRIEIAVQARSPGEGATLRIVDPQGRTAAEAGGELAKWTRLSVRPPASLRGQAWALDISKHTALSLDDIAVYIDGGTPPLLALNPNWVGKIARRMRSLAEQAQRGEAK